MSKTDTPPFWSPASWTDRQLTLSVFLFAFVFWSPALFGKFAWDDANNLVDGRRLREWSAFFEVFRHDAMWSANMDAAVIGTYRPISLASFVLDYQFFGGSAFGYHLSSVLWHAGATTLAFLLLRRFVTVGQALVATALFCVHPVNAEAVAWINGRSEVFALLFGAAGGLLLARAEVGLGRTLAGALCLLGALLGKESGVVFLGVAVLLATEARHRARGEKGYFVSSTSLPAVSAALLALIAYLGIRSAVFGGNPLPGAADKLDMFPSAGAVFLRCVQSALTPVDIAVTYLYLWYNHLTDVDRVVGWASVLTISALLVFAWLKGRRTIVLFFAWWAVSVAPVLVLVGRDWPGLARWLYMGGPGLMAALTLAASDDRVLRVTRAVGIVFGLYCAVLAQRSIQVWYDSQTIYTRMIYESPEEPFGFLSLSWMYLRMGEYQDCVDMANRAIALGPRGHDVHAFLIAGLAGLNRCDEARAEIVAKGPGWTRGAWMLYAVGSCFDRAKRPADAKPFFDECAPKDTACAEMAKSLTAKLGSDAPHYPEGIAVDQPPTTPSAEADAGVDAGPSP